MCALPIDHRPSLRFFLLAREVWPKTAKDSPRLFASLEEAREAADGMAQSGRYTDFAIYVIERGRLRQLSSAAAKFGGRRITLVWAAESDQLDSS